MTFSVIIPARFGSTRFPGKALAPLQGKAMVVRVCERAARSGADSVHVATDDERIAAAVRAEGYGVVMTRADHASGTDRLAEAAVTLGLNEHAVVVNVQGDEPLIAPESIRLVAATLAARADASMATLCHPLRESRDIFNPNVVKVVLDARGDALYFSRAPVPWARDAYAQPEHRPPDGLPCYRHVGIYAYRAGFLARYAGLAEAPLERFEALEQLRVLWNGYRIAVSVSAHESAPGVDTPEDLVRAEQEFRSFGAAHRA